VINDQDWPQTLDNIHEFLVFTLDVTGAHLDYVIRVDSNMHYKANNPADAYLMVDPEITYRVRHSGTVFISNCMVNICRDCECWIYQACAVSKMWKNGL
jgi:hypothetical protein